MEGGKRRSNDRKIAPSHDKKLEMKALKNLASKLKVARSKKRLSSGILYPTKEYTDHSYLNTDLDFMTLTDRELENTSEIKSYSEWRRYVTEHLDKSHKDLIIPYLKISKKRSII
ncbi:unnamed protein product [Moneuplotes crassus]|uniref:Uncharacterized protein n=1 Tax=Euplotes crassus TaxID=5936 RepID=A0AAD2D3R9_EUPCR|nr:unnamed protein product [Moneuplotes crassus]